HGGRTDSARRGDGLRLQVPGRGPGDGLLLRRGRCQPGVVPRDAEHGLQVEPAGHLPLREQPLRDGHRLLPRLPPPRGLQACLGVRDAGGDRGRDGRDQGLRGGAGLRGALPLGERAGPPRDQHLPLPRPLDVRSRHLPHQRRGGAEAEGRPDSQAPAVGGRAPQAARGRLRGHRRRGEGHRGRGGEVRRHLARAVAGGAAHRHLRRARRGGRPAAGAGPRGEGRMAQLPQRTDLEGHLGPRAPRAGRGSRGQGRDEATGAGLRETEEIMAEQTWRDALNHALSEEMERDANVFLLGEEVARYNGAYKVSQGLLDKFGSARVVDAPISELGFAGLGVGAAMVGLRPVIEMMTWNFAILAMDQIVNNAAKLRHMSGGQLRCPIVFRGPNGAGGRLSSQHSQSLEANYAHFPGLKILAPSTPADAKGLLKAAIRDDNPVIFLEAELLYGVKGEVPPGEYVLPIGKADLKRQGNDCTIVTWSRMYYFVEQAARQLEAEGIHVDLLDLRTLKPLDEEAILTSVRKTNRLVVVEEGWSFCGVGAQIADLVQLKAFDELDAPVERVTGLDVNRSYAANLEKATEVSAERIVAAVKRVMYREEG